MVPRNTKYCGDGGGYIDIIYYIHGTKGADQERVAPVVAALSPSEETCL